MIVGATSASYMPVADEVADDSDVGRYLLAVVSYTDAKRNVEGGAFSEDARDKAGLVSVNPVAEDTRNKAPVFEDQDSNTPGTQNQTATREVAESAKAEANVGNAVTAKDPDPNEDPLIYALSGADAALFSVDADDAATADVDEGGQITVKFGTKLDFETRATYMVTITATDSFSDSASIDVTITVTDADEAPNVTGDATKEYAENGTDSVATYTAVDPEGAAIAWSLSGADAPLFSIEGGVLAFVNSPNFEDAKDVGEDSIYDVMVEATDGTGHVGRETVMVEVTNVDEAGTVKLSALHPASGVVFTATLRDLDNGPADLTSQRRVAVVQVPEHIQAAGTTSTRPRLGLTHPRWMAKTLVTTCGRRPSTRTNRVLVAPITTRRHPWYRPTKCWCCGPPTRLLSSPKLWRVRALT